MHDQELNNTPELHVADINKSGFKRRYYTFLMFGWAMFIGLITFVMGMWSFISNGFFPTQIIQFLVAGWMACIALSMLWCEVEDQGDALSVRFGPMNVLCGMGAVIIPYDQIKSYRVPSGYCEKKCGWGVAKVNMCVSGGLRQHALCGGTRPLIIEYRHPQRVCGKPYCQIMIAVSKNDYQDFIHMLYRKFGIVSKTGLMIV